MTILITATIYKQRKINGYNGYIACAEELNLRAEASLTREGALRNLKRAVHSFLVAKAREGSLADLLEETGYPIQADPMGGRYQPNIQDCQRLTLPLPKTAENHLRKAATARAARTAPLQGSGEPQLAREGNSDAVS